MGPVELTFDAILKHFLQNWSNFFSPGSELATRDWWGRLALLRFSPFFDLTSGGCAASALRRWVLAPKRASVVVGPQLRLAVCRIHAISGARPRSVGASGDNASILSAAQPLPRSIRSACGEASHSAMRSGQSPSALPPSLAGTPTSSFSREECPPQITRSERIYAKLSVIMSPICAVCG